MRKKSKITTAEDFLDAVMFVKNNPDAFTGMSDADTADRLSAAIGGLVNPSILDRVFLKAGVTRVKARNRTKEIQIDKTGSLSDAVIRTLLGNGYTLEEMDPVLVKFSNSFGESNEH